MEGKTLVVTGGASGLGKAVAHLFASRGANVAIISSPWPDDHNKDESYYTEREIEERYGKVVVSFCILLASLFGLISNKFVHREFSLLLIVRIASPCQPTSPMSTRWKQPSRELLTTLVRTFSPLHSSALDALRASSATPPLATLLTLRAFALRSPKTASPAAAAEVRTARC
jgi:hypothetical protein